jgi:ribosomal protein S18
MRGIKSKAKKSRKKKKTTTTLRQFRRRVLSISQLIGKIRNKHYKKPDYLKDHKYIKPIIPPKAFHFILKEKPQKLVYNQRIIDYKHCGLLENYIGVGGKILPRRQTDLNAKQQRYLAKTIKTARIMGFLPFVNKEKSYFR